MGATGTSLDEKLAGKPYASVVSAVARASVQIRAGFAGRASSGKAGTKNSSGDEQDAMDVWADTVVENELRSTGAISLYASEERASAVHLGGSSFSVVCDPLDGSSNIPINLPVGTIFGIFPGEKLGLPCSDIICAGYVLYGPLTVLVLADASGVDEFVLADGAYLLQSQGLKIPPGKDFVVSESKKKWTPGYARFVERCYAEGCKARNVASMVADFHRALKKGGIYTYPGTQSSPDGKIRLLFEAGPMSFIAERAGGAGHDGRHRLLGKIPKDLHAKTPVFVGSKNLADIAMQEMRG